MATEAVSEAVASSEAAPVSEQAAATELPAAVPETFSAPPAASEAQVHETEKSSRGDDEVMAAIASLAPSNGHGSESVRRRQEPTERVKKVRSPRVQQSPPKPRAHRTAMDRRIGCSGAGRIGAHAGTGDGTGRSGWGRRRSRPQCSLRLRRQLKFRLRLEWSKPSNRQSPQKRTSRKRSPPGIGPGSERCGGKHSRGERSRGERCCGKRSRRERCCARDRRRRILARSRPASQPRRKKNRHSQRPRPPAPARNTSPR